MNNEGWEGGGIPSQVCETKHLKFISDLWQPLRPISLDISKIHIFIQMFWKGICHQPTEVETWRGGGGSDNAKKYKFL